MRRILILGGTSEAVRLAAALADHPDTVITVSLAGRTRRPRLPAGRVRLGGFGGVDGLARYLRERSIALLIDATHPFAGQISTNAARAADIAGVDLLVLRRPDELVDPDVPRVADVDAALRVAGAKGRRLLVTFRLDAQVRVPEDCTLLVRAIEPPAAAPLVGTRWLLARGPYEMDSERRLLERHAIDALIAKASGGEQSKIAAARALGILVVLIDRPAPPSSGAVVTSIEEAIRRLAGQDRGRNT